MLGLPKDISEELAKFLEDDERPIDFRKEPWSYYKRNRWVILTDKRVYLIKKAFFGMSYDIKQIILSMAHFEMVEGVLLDTIYIRVPSEGEHIINFFPTDRRITLAFLEEVEKMREKQTEKQQAETKEAEKTATRVELETLAKTFYENLISSEEYERKKKDLLRKL